MPRVRRRERLGRCGDREDAQEKQWGATPCRPLQVTIQVVLQKRELGQSKVMTKVT